MKVLRERARERKDAWRERGRRDEERGELSRGEEKNFRGSVSHLTN